MNEDQAEKIKVLEEQISKMQQHILTALVLIKHQDLDEAEMQLILCLPGEFGNPIFKARSKK